MLCGTMIFLVSNNRKKVTCVHLVEKVKSGAERLEIYHHIFHHVIKIGNFFPFVRTLSSKSKNSQHKSRRSYFSDVEFELLMLVKDRKEETLKVKFIRG